MSLKAIHSIYSFSEAPERESLRTTADITLKIVQNIQFGNNFTSISLFFPSVLSPLLLRPPLPEGGPLPDSSWGHSDGRDVLSPPEWPRGGREGRTPPLSSWWEHLLPRTEGDGEGGRGEGLHGIQKQHHCCDTQIIP